MKALEEKSEITQANTIHPKGNMTGASNFMAIHPCQPHGGAIGKGRVHLLWTMNLCAKFHVNPFNSC